MMGITLTLLQLIACGGAPAGPSVADLEAAKADVHAMAPWDTSIEGVKAKLGEPAASTEEASTWAAKSGDACKLLKIQNIGGTIGNVELSDGPCP